MGWQGQPRPVSEEEDSEWVCLHPFNHQVGGHCGVLLFDKTTICKPLVPAEYGIYETMSPALRKFVPKLKGWINVNIRKDTEGNTYLFTLSKKRNGARGIVEECSECQRSNAHGYPETNGGGQEKLEKEAIKNGNKSSTCAFHATSMNLRKVDQNYEVADNFCETLNNPWSVRCWKRQLWTFERAGVTKSCKYILLENLASKFKHPSILDLKIGTRGYGDDVTEEKRQAHVAKAKLSTTGTLGIRIGGMQVYQVNKDNYRRRTKHYGKSVADYNTLLSTIKEFFHNGNSICKDVLMNFIQRLKTLISVIQNEEGCRFFGCSLLILYEGGTFSQTKETSQADATRSSDLCSGDTVPLSSIGVHECAEPLMQSSDIPCDDIHNSKRESENNDLPLKKLRVKNGSITHLTKDSLTSREPENASTNHPATSSLTNPSGSSGKDLILKVIDFPHVSYQNELTSTRYEGPDEDFLFGLNNLLEMVEKIFFSL